MTIPISQAEIESRFRKLIDSGMSDRDAVRFLFENDLIGLLFLWKPIASHRNLERRDAMKFVLAATKEVREKGGAPRPLPMDATHCPRCREKLFVVRPGQTTREEIVEFASHASMCEGTSISEDGWIHPGRYCPNGCITELWEFGYQDLWDRMERNRAMRETASILVRLESPGSTTLEDVKIYLDRNIRRTARRNTTLENCEYIELEPGTHTIIVRDYDALDPNRRESEQIEFAIGQGQQIEFCFADADGRLTLHQKKAE